MHTPKSWLAVVVVGIAGTAGLAAAEPAERASVVVPIVGAGGRPVFCGHNHSGGRAQPQADGGYRVTGLLPGRHVVHLELADERVDVLVTVAAGEDVVVPPVVVRGPCRALALRAPVVDVDPQAEPTTWALRIGRRYQARPAMTRALIERDRGVMRGAAERAALQRSEQRSFTRNN